MNKVYIDEATRAKGLAIAPDVLNAGITQLIASADEGAGVIHLVFAYNSSVWPLVGATPFSPKRITVALYDKNGQLLTQFTTQEFFVPKEFVGVFPIASEALMPDDNHLQYPVNARDLAFAEYILVGFDAGASVIDRRDRKRTEVFPPIKQRWAEKIKPVEEELSRLRAKYGITYCRHDDDFCSYIGEVLTEQKAELASRQASLAELETKVRAEKRQGNTEKAQLAYVEKQKEELRGLEQEIRNRESTQMPDTDITAGVAAYKDTWNRLQDMRKQEKEELDKADAEILRTISRH